LPTILRKPPTIPKKKPTITNYPQRINQTQNTAKYDLLTPKCFHAKLKTIVLLNHKKEKNNKSIMKIQNNITTWRFYRFYWYFTNTASVSLC
jgi:hypothetical protein